jgi:hypothetical protein
MIFLWGYAQYNIAKGVFYLDILFKIWKLGFFQQKDM